jgi:heme-degrading monooxygenase HmoA
MAAILIQHRVKDYAAWKKAFDSFHDFRISSGELSAQVFHDAKDPNVLTVLNKWDTLEKAQKFANSPDLRAAMEKAGVEGMPSVFFLNEA